MSTCYRTALVAAFLLHTTLPATRPALASPVPSGGELQINTFSADDQDTATVAVAADGSFVVVWESLTQDTSANGVFVRRFDAAGLPLDDEQQVNTETSGQQEDPDVAVLAGGGFVVVWDSDSGQDGDLRGVFGQRFDAAGQAAGDEFQVNVMTVGEQNDAVVAAAADGGFLVVWETDFAGVAENLVARRFDAAGEPLSGEISVNTFTPGDQEDADVASDAAGNFVVVWESEFQDGILDSIVARRLDPDGQPMGDEIVVNTFFDGNQENPDLAVAADGSFAIVWEDDTQDAFVDAVYGRYYAADGTATSAAFQIDADPGRQMNPRVALDSRGHAVVIWDSLDQDGDGIGVFLNSFDLAGQAEGAEQQVNITFADDQLDPHIVVKPSDEALAVWESGGGQDGAFFGVFARRYTLDVFSDGFESGDTTAWSGVSP